jgi:hypothetical protein
MSPDAPPPPGEGAADHFGDESETEGQVTARETGPREPGPGRKPAGIIGAATRDAITRATSADLTKRQHRTFLAVLSLTTAWSKHVDFVYLAHIAQAAYGQDRVEDWQIRKTSEDLRALTELGVIRAVAPKGRPTKGRPYRYYIEIPWPHDWVETHPKSGSDNGSKPGNAPQFGTESDPDLGQKGTPLSGTPPLGSPDGSPRRPRCRSKREQERLESVESTVRQRLQLISQGAYQVADARADLKQIYARWPDVLAYGQQLLEDGLAMETAA